MITFDRQLDLFNPQDNYAKTPITLVGCGSVGSMVALLLSKVGFHEVEVFDDDTVEEHNIPNQFFRVDDMHKPKVEAIREVCYEMGFSIPNGRKERYQDQVLKPIVISAVDSMATRKIIFEEFKKQSGVARVLIDPRMGGLNFRIVTVRQDNTKFYSWYPDDESVQEPCTARTIVYNVGVLAGLVVAQVCKVVRGEEFPYEIGGDIRTMEFGSLWSAKKKDEQLAHAPQ